MRYMLIALCLAVILTGPLAVPILSATGCIETTTPAMVADDPDPLLDGIDWDDWLLLDGIDWDDWLLQQGVTVEEWMNYILLDGIDWDDWLQSILNPSLA